MKLNHRVRFAAIGLAVGASFGATMGAMAECDPFPTTSPITPEEARDDLAAARDDKTEAEKLLVDVQKRVGEACLGIMAPYRDDGILAYVEEDTAVSDLLADPTKRCGDSPTAVRFNLATLRDAEATVLTASDNITYAEIYVEDAVANPPEEDITGQDILMVSGVLGVIGAAAGAVVGRAKDSRTYAGLM